MRRKYLSVRPVIESREEMEGRIDMGVSGRVKSGRFSRRREATRIVGGFAGPWNSDSPRPNNDGSYEAAAFYSSFTVLPINTDPLFIEFSLLGFSLGRFLIGGYSSRVVSLYYRWGFGIDDC